jgi:uncharacterized protein YdeI (YjbR/CyaY-like superfamily)
MSFDPRIDAYIEKQAEFARPILTHIRERMHIALPEIEEAIKWSHGFFSYKGRPLAGMAAFKAHATFGFWDNAVGESASSAAMQRGKFTCVADLPDDATLDAQIREAAARIDAGKKPGWIKRGGPPRPEAEVPPELAEALADDDAAAAAFNGFPPGCRREYCEWIAEAKRPETKARRVAEAVGWMREGKRRNWKYENC